MSIEKVIVTVDRQTKRVTPSVLRSSELYEIFNIKDGYHLFLELDGDIDIPIAKTDYLALRGGESFSTAATHNGIESNPLLRKPIEFKLNDVERTIPRPKYSVEDIKQMDGAIGTEDRFVVDIKDIVDAVLDNEAIILVRPGDTFITTPSEVPKNIIVKIDGNEISLAAGKYPLAQLKALLGVPDHCVLDVVIDCELVSLEEEKIFHLRKEEVFFSHCKQGCSS